MNKKNINDGNNDDHNDNDANNNDNSNSDKNDKNVCYLIMIIITISSSIPTIPRKNKEISKEMTLDNHLPHEHYNKVGRKIKAPLTALPDQSPLRECPGDRTARSE